MRAQVKPGQREAFMEAMRGRGTAQRNPGFISVEMAFEDKNPDRVVAVIHFKDRDGYMANADRPETNNDYQSMLDYLVAPPEWTDVHYVAYEGEPLSAATIA